MPNEVAKRRQTELFGRVRKELLGLVGQSAKHASGIGLCKQRGAIQGAATIGIGLEDSGDGGVSVLVWCL